MKSCAVFGCNSKSGKTSGRGVSFYRLPLKDKDKQLLDVWVARLRTPSMPLNKNTRVCSRHWQDNCRKSFHDPPNHWDPKCVAKTRKTLSSISSRANREHHRGSGDTNVVSASRRSAKKEKLTSTAVETVTVPAADETFDEFSAATVLINLSAPESDSKSDCVE